MPKYILFGMMTLNFKNNFLLPKDLKKTQPKVNAIMF